MGTILMALENIMINPLRSLLTTTGIVIGIAAVIIVVAIGEGNREVIQKKIKEMGANLLYIGNYSRIEDTGDNKFLDLEDITQIKQRASLVEEIAPEAMVGLWFRYKNKYLQFEVVGTNTGYQKVMRLMLIEGRFLTSFDEREQRLVCVLNESGVGKLIDRGKKKVLGEEIFIDGIGYEVVGIVKDKASLYGGSVRPLTYIPLSTLKNMFLLYLSEMFILPFRKRQMWKKVFGR